MVLGPTAVGKTDLTIKMANIFDAEVLNADSRQIFKEMRIGTARPTVEQLEGVKHHFVASKSLSEEYSAGEFEADALQILQKIYISRDRAILSGGSGLYIKALCEGFDHMPAVKTEVRSELNAELKTKGLSHLVEELRISDPTYFDSVDPKNPHRVIRALEVIRSSGKPFSFYRKKHEPVRPFSVIKIGLNRPRAELYERINVRMDQMIEEGLFAEAESLIDYKKHNVMQTVGYQEVFGYLDKKYSYNEAVRLLKRNSRRYAKRQLTWFNRDEEITWYHPQQENAIFNFIQERLNREDFNHSK